MKEELTRVGQALGGMRYVQGPGGNVSVKDGGTLWIKASGRRLREMGEPGSLAEVALERVERAMAGDEAAAQEVFSRSPRPSLETYFHAMGARFVAHTHAVGALLVACTRSFAPPDAIGVPYQTPGPELARAVSQALGDRSSATLVLRSHGLLIYADSADEAIERTQSFNDACLRARPELPDLDRELAARRRDVKLAQGGVYVELPPRQVDKPRYLFPDATVFASVVRTPEWDDPATAVAAALAQFKRPVVLVADDGQRLHCARNADELAQACEVGLAHDWIDDALGDQGAPLTDDEAAKIVTMPSEQYRLQLTRK